jgi:hypothetical protein
MRAISASGSRSLDAWCLVSSVIGQSRVQRMFCFHGNSGRAKEKHLFSNAYGFFI